MIAAWSSEFTGDSKIAPIFYVVFFFFLREEHLLVRIRL